MVSAVQSQLINAQLAPISLGNQISTAVAAKALDSEKQEGNAALTLLADATQSAPSSSPTGNLLDLTA